MKEDKIMSIAVMIILGLLAFLMISFGMLLVKNAFPKLQQASNINDVAVYFGGLITNFLDTLGIGSFAQQTAFYKYTKFVDERILPGTLNVSNCIPIIVQAIIYIGVIEVDVFTLVVLILAAVVGSYFSAGIISKLPKKHIRIIMGIALLCVSGIMLARNIGFIETLGTGTATSLEGQALIIGVVVFFVLGVLMSAGVGLYAPAMATVYLLGMSPAVAFPIMMGACAFLMPVNSYKFIKEEAYSPRVAILVTFAGVMGVVIAAHIVTSLDLTMLTYLVIVVVFITGCLMLYQGIKDEQEMDDNKKEAA